MSPHLRPACFFLLFGLLSAPSSLAAELPCWLATECARHARQQLIASCGTRIRSGQIVKPHLPDPATATAEQLETVGDVLRARRFPEDALDYYRYALKRGAIEVMLMNKIGVTQLELRHTAAARPTSSVRFS